MSARLAFVRHGQTDWNAEGLFQGQADIPLNDVGRAQAAALAPALAALNPDAIVSSPLLRARATAEAIAEASGLDVAFDPRLAEINVGTWMGRKLADVGQEHPEMLADLAAGRDFRRSETGETATEAGARVAGAARYIADWNPDGLTVVVGHGLATRMGILNLLGWDMVTGLGLTGLWNCSFSVLERRDRWRILSYNNVVAS